MAWLSGESPDRPESVRPCHRGLASARTDAEGVFKLESLPPGWWTVRASAAGWLPADSERRQVRAGHSLEGLEIGLGRGETIAGRVLSPEPGENRLDLKLERDRRREIRGRVLGPGGAPLIGARVLGPSSSWTTADGTFVLRERDGRHEIWAQAEGYAPAQTEVVVQGGPVGGVEIRLSRGGTLQGRLLGLDREGLSAAKVRLFTGGPSGTGGWAYTRSNGSFRIELEEGVYRGLP